METWMGPYLHCAIMMHVMTDMWVYLVTFMPLLEVTGCPVYDDRYDIHTYDGL
jgi:hypothetical protein